MAASKHFYIGPLNTAILKMKNEAIKVIIRKFSYLLSSNQNKKNSLEEFSNQYR